MRKLINQHLVIFFILLMVSCKNDYYLEDMQGKKINLSELTLEKPFVLFIVIDMVSCHFCIINLSKHFNRIVPNLEEISVFGVAVVDQNTVASRKLLQNFFKESFKSISNVFFISRNNKFFSSFCKDNFKPPILIFWKKAGSQFYFFNYYDLFDENGKLKEKSQIKIKKLIDALKTS